MRNTADALVYQGERFLITIADGLPEEMRQDVETKIAGVRGAQDAEDTNQLRDAVRTLRDALIDLNPGHSAPAACPARRRCHRR